MHIYKLKLFKYSLGSWQKQLMDSHHNLIDFSGEEKKRIQPPKTATPITSTTTTNTVVSTTGIQNDNGSETTQSNNAAKMAGKSKFEITRVETRENEIDMDDTVSEPNESSLISDSDLILKQSASESSIPIQEGQAPQEISSNTNIISNDGITPLTSNTALSLQQTQSQNSQHQIPQNSQLQNQQSTDPPSRFRIVKIAKQKPYEKGNWMVNDFNDTQKQTESTSAETPSSPALRKRNPTSDSGGTVTSPNEPVKTKSSEFLAQAILPSQSRGSSYNTVDRRSSAESTSVSDSNSQTTLVTPIVEALEGAMDHIQLIRDSMLHSVTDEMKRLRDNLASVQVERNRLKEENDILKRKLTVAEQRLSALDKG